MRHVSHFLELEIENSVRELGEWPALSFVDRNDGGHGLSQEKAGRGFLWNMLEQLQLGSMQGMLLRMPLLYK